ncbi:MAG: hypothetical protein AB7U79_06570 [Candidatus Izemoplasmatales bacterium]
MKKNILLIFSLLFISLTFLSCTSASKEEMYQDEIKSAVFLLSSGVKSDYQGFSSATLSEIYLTFEDDNPVVVIKSSITNAGNVFNYYTLVTFVSGMTNEVYVGSSDTLVYAFEQMKSAYENGDDGYFQIDLKVFEDYYQEVLG